MHISFETAAWDVQAFIYSVLIVFFFPSEGMALLITQALEKPANVTHN